MRYLIALMLLVLVGCASVNFTPSSTQSFPAHTGDVAVLERLPDKYQEVGWVSVDTSNNYNAGNLLVMAKEKARERGANAIIYQPESYKIAYGRNSMFCRAIIYER